MRKSHCSRSHSEFLDIAECDEVVRIREGLELPVDSREQIAESQALCCTEVRGFAESTHVAKTGSARNYGISTVICKEMHRVVRGRAALCRGLADLCAENRLK